MPRAAARVGRAVQLAPRHQRRVRVGVGAQVQHHLVVVVVDLELVAEHVFRARSLIAEVDRVHRVDLDLLVRRPLVGGGEDPGDRDRGHR